MSEILLEKRPQNGAQFWVGLQQFTNPENAKFPPHIHEAIELLYGLSGEYYITVDNQRYFFGPGDLIIFNSWQCHEKHPVAGPEGEHLVITIHPEMFYTANYSSVEFRYSLPFFSQTLIKNRVVKPEGLRVVLENLVSELRKKQNGWEFAAKASVFQILLWIIRNNVVPYKSLGSYSENASRNICQAFSYIAAHYQERLSVREIADHCYMGYSYFSKMFKEITQKSCTEYINYFRVQKAETLLLEGNQTITEISSQVGFDDVSYFIKQFRKFKGISPKQYQLNLQKSNWDEKES